ncbi:hypothetical protein ADJ73_07150 [Arsenicicoccus sp. oral taxon 190]|nr:hypothetical protein ADJ73_07150 [Arsenicicoccus sp. oral taxon 190]
MTMRSAADALREIGLHLTIGSVRAQGAGGRCHTNGDGKYLRKRKSMTRKCADSDQIRRCVDTPVTFCDLTAWLPAGGGQLGEDGIHSDQEESDHARS